MQTRSVFAASLLVALIAGSSAVNAVDSRNTTKDSTMTSPSQRAPDRDHQSGGMQGGGMMGGMDNMTGGDGMMGRGMMGGMDGMGGMMGMMNGCSQMMGSATPHLPPGNDKLQLKMQAEIMQKTAEILSRYADQIGETK